MVLLTVNLPGHPIHVRVDDLNGDEHAAVNEAVTLVDRIRLRYHLSVLGVFWRIVAGTIFSVVIFLVTQPTTAVEVLGALGMTLILGAFLENLVDGELMDIHKAQDEGDAYKLRELMDRSPRVRDLVTESCAVNGDLRRAMGEPAPAATAT